MQYYQQQVLQGAPHQLPQCLSPQLNMMSNYDSGLQHLDQLLDAAIIGALPSQQQLQLQAPQMLQPFPSAQLQTPQMKDYLCPHLEMMACENYGPEELSQLLESAMINAMPGQQQRQQASQQLQLHPTAPLHLKQIMEPPVHDAFAPTLLQTVVSANTPDQLFSALDAYLGSALQCSTSQQHTLSTSLPQHQQQYSSVDPWGAASPTYLSSRCALTAIQQRSPCAAGSSTATTPGSTAAAGAIDISPAAAAVGGLPAGNSRPTSRDSCDSTRGAIYMQPATTTGGVAFKRVTRPTPLELRMQQQHEFVPPGSWSAPCAFSAPSGQARLAGSSMPVGGPGSSSGLELYSDSLTWSGSTVSNALAERCVLDCIPDGEQQPQQQQRQRQQQQRQQLQPRKLAPAKQQRQQQQLKAPRLGHKRRLDTLKSPYASCRQSSGGSSSSLANTSCASQQQQQQHGWQQRMSRLNVLGSGAMSHGAFEDCPQPPSPTTAAAAAAKVALQTAASSNLASGRSRSMVRSTLMWRQQQPTAAAAVSEGLQRVSSQRGASAELRMSVALMHYAD